MKRRSLTTIVLAMAFGAASWAQIDTLPQGLSTDIRTPEGLQKLIERNDPRFVIVDVRPPAEYAAGHIPTAINIPGGVTADIEAPPSRDKYVVIYCHGGRKSPAAAEKMLSDGYTHVFVWGGIMNWPYDRATPK